MDILANGSKYVIERDTFGLTLKSPINTVDNRNGDKKLKIHVTYPGTMGQALADIAEREMGKAKDVEELAATVKQLRKDLLSHRP